jgi:protease II
MTNLCDDDDLKNKIISFDDVCEIYYKLTEKYVEEESEYRKLYKSFEDKSQFDDEAKWLFYCSASTDGKIRGVQDFVCIMRSIAKGNRNIDELVDKHSTKKPRCVH